MRPLRRAIIPGRNRWVRCISDGRVHLHHRQLASEIAGRERAVGAEAGAVDQELDVDPPLLQLLEDPARRDRIGEILGDDAGRDAVLGRQPRRQRLQVIAAARDHDQIVPVAREQPRQLQAQPRRRPRDQCGFSHLSTKLLAGNARGHPQRARHLRVARGLRRRAADRTRSIASARAASSPGAPTSRAASRTSSRTPARGGALVGFEVDLADALARELGVRARFVQNDWTTLIPSLERGTFDVALNGIEVTPARAARVAFSRPYYLFAERLVARRGDARVRDLASTARAARRHAGGQPGLAAARRTRAPSASRTKASTSRSSISRTAAPTPCCSTTSSSTRYAAAPPDAGASSATSPRAATRSRCARRTRSARRRSTRARRRAARRAPGGGTLARWQIDGPRQAALAVARRRGRPPRRPAPVAARRRASSRCSCRARWRRC